MLMKTQFLSFLFICISFFVVNKASSQSMADVYDMPMITTESLSNDFVNIDSIPNWVKQLESIHINGDVYSPKKTLDQLISFEKSILNPNDTLQVALFNKEKALFLFRLHEFENARPLLHEALPFLVNLSKKGTLKGYSALETLRFLSYSPLHFKEDKNFPGLFTKLEPVFSQLPDKNVSAGFYLVQAQWHFIMRSSLEEVLFYFQLAKSYPTLPDDPNFQFQLNTLSSQIKAFRAATNGFLILLVFLIYSLVAYAINRTKDQLSYCLFLVFIVIYGAFEFNFYRYALVLQSTVGADFFLMLRDLFGFLALLFYNFFIVHFIKGNNIHIQRVLIRNKQFTKAFLIFILVFELIHYTFELNDFWYNVFLAIVIGLSITQNVLFVTRVWDSKNKQVRFIAIGSMIMLLALFGYMSIIILNLYEFTHWAYYILLTGIIIQAIIFNAGISFDAYYSQLEKLNLKEQLVSELEKNKLLVENQNQILELKVAQRTNELMRQNNELEQANEEIVRQRDEVIQARDLLETAIANLKNTQEQLIQQEKLASLGQLTAGIAHEIKNPLNFIINFSAVSKEMLQELKEEIKEDPNSEIVEELIEDLSVNLEKIGEHGNRSDRIIKSMLQHSRTTPQKEVEINIEQWVKEAVNLSYHAMRTTTKRMNCEIQFHFDVAAKTLIGQEQDLSRILINLCSNAFDAQWERLQKEPNFKPILKVDVKKEGKWIFISVEDNALGIDATTQKNIFNPFFTTKKGTEGTGLGLSISSEIAIAHGGQLTVASQPGQTRFTLTLPA